MRLLQRLACTGAIAAGIAGCSDSTDLASSGTSEPAIKEQKLLADAEYDRAESLASNARERAAVASARRAEGDRGRQRNKADAVLAMRQVLDESQIPEVRAAVAAGLGNSRDFDSIHILLNGMEDESSLVRQTSAKAIERMLDWSPDFRAEDPTEIRQEVIAKYRDRWTKFQASDMYKIYSNPDKKNDAKRLAERKAKAERRRERYPRDRNKE